MLGAGDSTLKVFIQSRLPALTPLEDMMLSKNEVYHHIVEHIPITSVCVCVVSSKGRWFKYLLVYYIMWGNPIA